MRSALRNGRIVPPASFRAAEARRRQLVHEIGRIQAQLDDPTRALTKPSMRNYDEWHASARHALKLFEAEARQLEEWMGTHQDTAEELLADAYAVLRTLEDETDFEPDETELMKRLERYFAAQVKKTA